MHELIQEAHILIEQISDETEGMSLADSHLLQGKA